MAIGITHRKWFILLATAAITTFLVMLINKPKEYEPVERVFLEKQAIVFGEVADKPDKNWRGLSKNEVCIWKTIINDINVILSRQIN